LPRYAKTLTPFITPQGIKGAGGAKTGTGGRVIAGRAGEVAGAGTGAGVRETNNETGLTAGTAPKKDVTAANAVIIEGEPGNAKAKAVKTGTELFKAKVVARPRRRLTLNLISFCSRKPKIIKFAEISLRVRWVILARTAVKRRRQKTNIAAVIYN